MTDISKITLEQFQKFRDEFEATHNELVCAFCPVAYECDLLIQFSNEMNVNSDHVGCDEIFEITKKTRANTNKGLKRQINI